MTTEQKLREALENLANVYHEGRVVPLNESSAGYVNAVVRAAEDALTETALSLHEQQAPQGWMQEVADLTCPDSYGFEGPGTFPDCGKCVVCRARAAIKVGGVAQDVPQGWKLVPVEPTDAMVVCGMGASGREVMELDIEDIYLAMLSASPAAPEAAKPEVERAELLRLAKVAIHECPAHLNQDWQVAAMRVCKGLAALLAADSKAAHELAAMEARKDAAYLERNRVVAALARVFPSGVARTAIEGWSEDWHGCVYIDLPTGQASWHFHDSQAYLFEGLPPYSGAWDGHSTDEKYERLARLRADGEPALWVSRGQFVNLTDPEGDHGKYLPVRKSSTGLFTMPLYTRPQQQAKPCGNVGHGHVFPRPDGGKAKCGGPSICSECASDAAAQRQGDQA